MGGGIMESSRLEPRMQACLPEDFVGHPVSNTGKKLLDQKQRLQRSASAAAENVPQP
jgi:hypothetical protein